MSNSGRRKSLGNMIAGNTSSSEALEPFRIAPEFFDLGLSIPLRIMVSL